MVLLAVFLCLGTELFLVLNFSGRYGCVLFVLVSQIWLLRFSYHLSGKLKTLDIF